MTSAKIKEKKEFGDYQTPQRFADLVCEKLKANYKLNPKIILEPTCGVGSFLISANSIFPNAEKVIGIEINEQYYEIAKTNCKQEKFNIFQADVFSFDYIQIRDELNKDDEILIIGNPPWATNSLLKSVYSYNTPLKSNIKQHAGFDAITGKSNFDISEYIILQLLSEFDKCNCTLAFLCKTNVAKNIIRDYKNFPFSISSADMYIINSSEIFGISCEACLFVVKLGKVRVAQCNVFDFETNELIRKFGWIENSFYSNISAYSKENIDGVCQFDWRQGVKHDCSKVMELTDIDGRLFKNNLGETLELKRGINVLPLIKSSDIKTAHTPNIRKWVIVTQRFVNDDTNKIKTDDPLLWEYLQKHKNHFNNRRSIIYKKAPPFAIFGIGEYSFAKYKVAISGFYKNPIFSFINGDYTKMLDDTCYFLSFDNADDAYIATALLNNKITTDFLKSIAFLDNKRPFTKELLKRIDFAKLINSIPYNDITDYVKNTFSHSISKNAYEKFINSVVPAQIQKVI